MPLPIKPVHSLDLHAEIFDGPSMEGLGLSDIQIQLLGVSSAPKREAAKLSNRDIEILKAIDSNQDDLVTAASQIALHKDSKICNGRSQCRSCYENRRRRKITCYPRFVCYCPSFKSNGSTLLYYTQKIRWSPSLIKRERQRKPLSLLQRLFKNLYLRKKK